MATQLEIHDIKMIDLTEEEFLALGEDVNAEIKDGELIIMSPNRANHGFFGAQLIGLLRAYLSVRNIGRVFGDNTTYILKENPGQHILKDAKVPDVSYVSYERLPEDAALDQLLRLAPNIAVEIISESEKFPDVADKVRIYLEYDVEQVWLVFPQAQEIRVCTSEQPLGIVHRLDDTLSAGEILPGFEIPLRAVFDAQDHALYAKTLQKLLSQNPEA